MAPYGSSWSDGAVRVLKPVHSCSDRLQCAFRADLDSQSYIYSQADAHVAANALQPGVNTLNRSPYRVRERPESRGLEIADRIVQRVFVHDPANW